MGGQEVRQGFSGSVRFDVVQYKDDVPVMAWDFKTGQATLSQSRIDKMHSISGLDIPIIELKGR